MANRKYTTKVVVYDKAGEKRKPRPIGSTLSLSEEDGEKLAELGLVQAAPASHREVEQPKKPAGEALTTAIVAAIGAFDKGDGDLWTGDGKPNVNALEKALGYSVSAAERDAAWAEVQAAAEQPSLPNAG